MTTNRYIIIALASLLSCCFSGGISAKDMEGDVKGNDYISPLEEVLRDKSLSTTNHRRYPDNSLPAEIAHAPEGYVPFHISTYARHGSRFLMARESYADALAPLLQAEKDGVITPDGLKVKHNLEKILAKADEGRYGELTPLGARQHRGIARRMYANFPEVFADSASVDARSTTVIRCIMSMMAECLELQSLNPRLKIFHDASLADMYYLNDVHRSDSLHEKYRALRDREKSKRKSRLAPERVLNTLYSSPEWIKNNIADSCDTYYNLFYVASNMQSHDDEGLDIMWIFTPEECCELWKVNNADWYLHSGDTPLTGHDMPFQQLNLLKEFIKDGNNSVNSRCPSATLRFGHESIVLPTVVLLGIDGFGYVTDDLDAVSEHWAVYKAFPMAANIQLVLYENPTNPEADVLVRVLLNEKDARLPLEAVADYFYRWTDFAEFYTQKLAAAATSWIMAS